MKFSEFEKIINNLYKDIKLIKNDKTTIYNSVVESLLNKMNQYINFKNVNEIEKFIHSKKIIGCNLIDVGCGLGDKTIMLKQILKKCDIYGVETLASDDPEHKEFLPYNFYKKYYPVFNKKYKVNLSSFDGYNLNFPDNFFNVILLYAVIEHVEPKNREKFLNSLYKKLKKDGYIIIARCPRFWSLNEFILRKLQWGAHKWVLKKSELIGLFDDRYKVEKLIINNNIPANPSKITNKLLKFLIILNELLTFFKWPFATDYFLILKKLK